MLVALYSLKNIYTCVCSSCICYSLLHVYVWTRPTNEHGTCSEEFYSKRAAPALNPKLQKLSGSLIRRTSVACSDGHARRWGSSRTPDRSSASRSTKACASGSEAARSTKAARASRLGPSASEDDKVSFWSSWSYRVDSSSVRLESHRSARPSAPCFSCRFMAHLHPPLCPTQ